MDDAARLPAPRLGGIHGIDRLPFEMFLIHEARLLDSRRFRDWMGLFTDDGTYWVPAVPDQSSPFDQASLFYDDRQLMQTRIDRLEHPRIHMQTPPSRTVHLIGNVEAFKTAREGTMMVRSNFSISEFWSGETRTLTGSYGHRFVEIDGQGLIQCKRVDLIEFDQSLRNPSIVL